MAKKKKNKSKLVGMGISFLIGAAGGIMMVVLAERHIPYELSFGQFLLWMSVLILGFFAAYFLHIPIHEAGHLVFGLISGYQFTSFRIGSFMWVTEDGKLRLKRFSLAGTGGQCLMAPPDLVDGKMPVVLYNLGGSLMNLIVSLIFLLLYVILDPGSIFSLICILIAFAGILTALTNGIPMRFGMVDNDGYNALDLRRNPAAMRAFWLQMKVNEQIAKGLRVGQMPDEWFPVPPDDAMGSSMVAAAGVFACNRLMDQHRFGEADQLMAHLLEIESGMAGIHRNILICDRMYCEIIGENRREIVEKMNTKELQQFMRSMKTSPSIMRTLYAYALLVEQDETKAASILREFEKVAKNYPYPNDLQSDREMIQIAQDTYKKE